MTDLALTVPVLAANKDDSDNELDLIKTLYSQNIHLFKPHKPSSSKQYLLPFIRSLPIVNRILPEEYRNLEIWNLLEKQRGAVTYKEWYEISLKLDELLHNNEWKEDPKSDLYDYELVHNNLMEMRNTRLAKDYKKLLYLIRTKWIRNLGNMGNIELYRHAFVGTKELIEEYVKECELCLEFLINGEDVHLDDRYLLGMLIQTRKNVGRTALVLSGGSTFGFFHIGVLITLLESNLLPRIISGSSSGSIIASILCTHSNDEMQGLISEMMNRQFNIFALPEEDGLGENPKFKRLLKNLSHLLKYGTLFDIDGLQSTMTSFVGDLTFREAYNRTGRILNITVSPTSNHEQTRLLNYLTAPNCLIWSAVCASCSLPGVFPSTSIYEKIPKTNEIQEWNNDASMKFVDGSVDNDLPITRLLEMFNVDHIIACQVNPHVVPILKVSVSSIGGEVEPELNSKLKVFLNNCYDFMTSEFIHYLQILHEIGVYQTLSTKLITLISQQYSGDITILPDFRVRDFGRIFKNPTPEFIIDFVLRGARASWPKVTVIYNHCGVEFALDKAISLLRGRLITSSDNKLTYKESDDVKGKVNQNMSLITSPVMNTNSQPMSPVTPERVQTQNTNINSAPPNIRRHNSHNIPSTKTHRHTRNSLSTTIPMTRNNKVVRGRSTTSLSSMSYANSFVENSLLSDEALVNNGDVSKKEKSSPKVIRPQVRTSFSDYSKVNADVSDGTAAEKQTPKHNGSVSDRRESRRIRSACDEVFTNDALKSETSNSIIGDSINHRIHSYSDVPSKLFNFDYDAYQEESPFQNEPEDDASKEKPNLPKLSRNSSLKNSSTGLNRLKDNILSRSGNNSHANLKDAHYDALKSRLASLTSPDIRRPFLKSYLSENRVFPSLDFGDKDKNPAKHEDKHESSQKDKDGLKEKEDKDKDKEKDQKTPLDMKSADNSFDESVENSIQHNSHQEKPANDKVAKNEMEVDHEDFFECD